AEFHRQDEPVVLVPGAEQAHQIRMADALHDLQGTELRGEDVGALADEVQRDLEAAGAVRVPNLAEGAGAELADQLVVRGIRHRPAAGVENHSELLSAGVRFHPFYRGFSTM